MGPWKKWLSLEGLVGDDVRVGVACVGRGGYPNLEGEGDDGGDVEWKLLMLAMI